MALKLSQGLAQRMLGAVKAERNGITFAVQRGGEFDLIRDSASLFVASQFASGYLTEVHGFTTAGNNVQAPVLDVTASQLKFASGVLAGTEAAGDSVNIYQIYPGDLRSLAFDSQMDWYAGNRPTTPDESEGAATLLVSFSGVRLRGPYWDSDNKKAYTELFGSAETVTPVATGTATWFRLRLGGVFTTGASSTMMRIDGSLGVGEGTYDLAVVSTSIKTTQDESLTSARLYMKQAA